MMQKIKDNFKTIFVIVIILLIGTYIYNDYFRMDNLPTGTFISEIRSPKNKYSLKAYRINGGSLSGDLIRVELLEVKTKIVKNVYYDYPYYEVDMEWVDEDTVIINGKEFNPHKSTYHWRRNG